MPIYQITGKNGVVYRVNGPEGLTKAQVVADILSKFPEAGVPPQEENALEKVPIIGDAAAWLADIPLEAVSGLASTTKTVTDAFGAGNPASNFLKNVAEGAQDLRSSEARRDSLINAIDQQRAEGKGTWEEIKAAGRSFLRSPLDTTANVAGSAVPFIAAGVAGSALAPATGGASLIPIASMAGLGAVSAAGGVKGEIYDAVYEATYKTALEAGLDERTSKAKAEETAQRAQEYGGENTDQIAIAALIGAAAGATGFSRQIAGTIGRKAADRIAERAAMRAAGKKAPGAIRGAATGALEEAVPEAVQAGQERYATNLALRREGFDVDTWKGVAGQAAFEGIASLVLGGYGGARSANIERKLLDYTAAEFSAMPPDADDETMDAAAQRFQQRGFDEETSRTIAEIMRARKAAIEQQAAQMEQGGAVGEQPGPEPELQPSPEPTPPPVDPEEREALWRAYEAEAPSVIIPPVETVSPQAKVAEQLAEVGVQPLDEASFGSSLSMYDKLVGAGVTPPAPLVKSLASKFIDMQGTPSMDALMQGALAPAAQQFFANEAASLNEAATNKARATKRQEAAPESGPKPNYKVTNPTEQAYYSAENPAKLTPGAAYTILNNPVALSDYEAAGGDVELLEEIAYGPPPGSLSGRAFPQRGRRPKDTQTMDMFGALPLQEAPGEELKREELAAQQLSPYEERIARQEQVFAGLGASQERAKEQRQREEAEREETLGDIEYALRAQAPENAAYKVVYDPEDANPYKLVAETQLGKKPEEVLKAKTLQDFSDQVYGRMDELTPYIPPTPPALEQLEERESNEQPYPTVATRMIQDFTAEVDAARKAGLIDNLQRAELLRRLERPNAYRLSPKGDRMVPNDAIAKLEKAAIEAASVANNASAEERAAATAAAEEANNRLVAAVKNSLLNPARAALKSMVEMRQDEKLGARIRQKEAEKAGDTREARDAKIDREQLRVQRLHQGKGAKSDQRTPQQIEADLRGKLTSEVVDWLVDTAPNQAFATIARGVRNAIKRLQRFGVDIDFQIADDVGSLPQLAKEAFADAANAVAVAEGFSITVYVNPASAGTNTGMSYETLLHEFVHVATIPYLELGQNASLKGTRTARLSNDLRDVLASITNHIDQRKQSGEALTALEIQSIYDSNNAFENEQELLAWTLSNPDVMEYLNTVPYKGKQTIFQRFIEVVRNILGLSVKSDSALAEVLRIGNQLLYTGDIEAARVLSGDPNYKLNYAAAQKKRKADQPKEVKDAIQGASAGARRVRDTVSVYGIEDGINEATEANSKLRDALVFAEDTASPVRVKALKGMPTSGILNWLKRKSPAVHSAAVEVADYVRRMGATRNNLIEAANPIKRAMQDFVRKYGSEALAELRFSARINRVDPFAFETVEEALKGGEDIKAIEDALINNSNDKAMARKLIDEIKAEVRKPSDTTSVFKDKVDLSAPVQGKLAALRGTAINKARTELKVRQLAGRVQAVRDTYAAKERLAKQNGGLELYKAERDYHKDVFEARLALLDERLETEPNLDSEQKKRIRELRAELMREANDAEERKKSGDLFWDLDPDLFPKDYFPMMRTGKYWLRVSEDAKQRREEAFYTFESARDLAKAKRMLAKQLGVDPNDRTVFRSGNDIADLQEVIKSEDALMKRVFDLVNKARDQAKERGSANIDELLDGIFQTYLMTTPERSTRRRFLHAKEIAGFSLNVVDDFNKQVVTNANELTKLAFAGRIRTAVSAMKDVINDPERPDAEAVMLYDFARELEERAEQEINPPPPGSLAASINVLNRVSFLYFLTSAKTALTNFANIPMRVVPRFWREYGYTEGTRMWLKYMQMWDSLGRVQIERTNASFGDYIDAIMPSVNASRFVKNSADLQWAKKAAMERGVLVTTAETIAQNERANTLMPQSGVLAKANDITANTLKAMTFMFTGTENISRQATFYMAFELELNKFRKNNKPDEGESDKDFVERGRRQALFKAMEIVDDTIGNFANWERPSLTKGELSRGFFLFKMHPILQTKFMVGAFRDIIAAPLRGVARQATGRGKLSKQDTAEVAGALKELSGVLMMAGLLGGIAGLPLYTIMVEALAYAFGPDPDDDDDVLKMMQEDAATVYDADIAFRRWLSNYLGVDERGQSTLANILIDGPLGVLTDTEISSTTTMDLVKMWYREPIAGDNLESTTIAALIANVAGFSTASQIMRGIDDFMDGNTREALKKISPAFFRSWVNAYYNSTEGVLNRKGDTIIPKEHITESDTFRSIVGARSLRLAKWQDYYITALKNEKRIEQEKKEILDEIAQKRRDGEFRTVEDFREYIKEVVIPFNRTYPNERFLITEESILRSLTSRDERSSRTLEGREINKKDAERILRSQEMFRPK